VHDGLTGFVGDGFCKGNTVDIHHKENYIDNYQYVKYRGATRLA
jgi:hypothetical protein